MLHYTKISAAIRKNENGEPKRFSFTAIAKSTGEIIRGEDCVCTSDYVHTVNVKWPSGEIRKLYKILFIEINGNKIFI
jgi:hypothetical protein